MTYVPDCDYFLVITYIDIINSVEFDIPYSITGSDYLTFLEDVEYHAMNIFNYLSDDVLSEYYTPISREHIEYRSYTVQPQCGN